jgi:mRNA-degrading endonuclease RelE of RelBE toxin-antitoxin system
MTDVDKIGLFEKDLKTLRKKYSSIDADLNTFVKALLVNLPDRLPETYRIPLGKEYVNDPVYKVKNFRCRSLALGSRSGIRLVYAYNHKQDKVTLLELYDKRDRTNHDSERIIQFLKKT